MIYTCLGLTNLRNQLNVKSFEDTLAPTDERIVLTKQWAEESSGLRELFDLWETSHPVRQSRRSSYP